VVRIPELVGGRGPILVDPARLLPTLVERTERGCERATKDRDREQGDSAFRELDPEFVPIISDPRTDREENDRCEEGPPDNDDHNPRRSTLPPERRPPRLRTHTE
jgi:hypothetical protein